MLESNYIPDLDAFCLAIQRELHEITTHTACDPNIFVFQDSNEPLAPTERMSAPDLIKNSVYTRPGGLAQLRRTLLHNWQEVNEDTRDPWQEVELY
jgi:ion channel-forming bestrophin family protein